MQLHIFKGITFMGVLCASIISNANTLSPIICLNKKCIPAYNAVTKEHLFEHINYLLEQSVNHPISICEADPISKNCLKKGIIVPLQVATSNINLDILSAKLTDVKKISETAGIDMIIDYKTKAGNIFPTCQTAPSRLGIFDKNTIQLIAPEFSCYLTQTTPVSLSLVQYIDYIDFDNGLVGMQYNVTSNSGTNNNGYAILKFQNTQPFKSHPQFPMPEVVSQFKEDESQIAHTQVAPVWMKPTPILNLEQPTYVDQDCMHTPQGCENLMLNLAEGSQPLVQANVNTPSTTGLIEQDKVVLPPLKGVRKTVTTRKQIIEDGKPVSIEEEVVQYAQETPSQPFVKVEQAPTAQEQSLTNILPSPEMPTVANAIQQMPSYTENIEFAIPNEVILTPNELQQIDQIAPIATEQKSFHQTSPSMENEDIVIIQEKSIPKEENTSLLDSLEKYFYF